MQNLTYGIDGDKLIITVDLSKDLGRSKSGKTIVIASTKGNINVDGKHYLGLNVYKYPEEAK